MDADVEELYSNINKLLEDICKFLTDEGALTKLSPQARKQADELLDRSKKQLKDIAQVTENGAYVDMERRQEDDDDENEIYSEPSAPATTPIISSVIQTKPTDENEDLPAQVLSKSSKNGMLSWKCRVFFNFAKYRKVYAGVHDQYLLIYSSENDSKPIHSFNLKFHIAKELDAKNKWEFELISASEDKKYYFLALTHKDLLQWISHINSCNKKFNRFLNDTEEINEEEDDDDVIYDTVLNPNQVKNSNNLKTSNNEIKQIITDKIVSQPPDLPARRMITIPLPPIPKIEQKQSNLNSSIDDDLNEKVETKPKVSIFATKPALLTESLESRKSFSSDDDDEDRIYGHVMTIETTPQIHSTVKPPIAAKPKPIKPTVQILESLRKQISQKSIESNSSFSDGDDDDGDYGTVVAS